MVLTLAYRPFIDPVDAHGLWYLLLIPLALGVSAAYKAVRVADLRDFPRAVLVMTAQIVLGMIALGFASYLFVQFVVPRLT
jgi:hypothetical protein